MTVERENEGEPVRGAGAREQNVQNFCMKFLVFPVFFYPFFPVFFSFPCAPLLVVFYSRLQRLPLHQSCFRLAGGFRQVAVGGERRWLVGGEGSGWQGAGLRCRHALHAFGRDNYNLVPQFVFVRIAPQLDLKFMILCNYTPVGISNINLDFTRLCTLVLDFA